MYGQAGKLLMIFIRNPEMGKVKTRLASDVGDTEALRIYQRLLETTRKVAGKVKAGKQLWYSTFVDPKDAWPEEHFEKQLQPQGDLGKRMATAFTNAFETGFQKVVIIGSDCPGISSELIENAFDKLSDHNVVVGPANDGGYYLLGMSSFWDLFENVAWSSPKVLPETIKKMRKFGLKYFMLPELTDLDTIEDLKNLPSL